LGDLQCRQRAGLCRHLGSAGQAVVLLEAGRLRPLEVYLPVDFSRPAVADASASASCLGRPMVRIAMTKRESIEWE
jgi:hypothetical protein